MTPANGITFGSVCSGIEAASVAWHPLGWRAAWLAEIEAFPSAVLAHHYPNVPNLGDMTTIAARIRAGTVPAPDVLVGGTPCQAFSVAGLRNSLEDARGQLTLSFVDLANAIDAARHVRGDPAAVVVWENVPGVTSTKDNAFGCFLGALAGEDSPLVAPRGKWPNAGCVFGPERTVAWRITDAQYFGVAQRRRRCFVIASARKGFDPTTVLFEFDGVRRDTAPRREAGQDAAAGAADGARIGSHWDGSDYPHPTLNQSNGKAGVVGYSNQEIFSQRGAYLVGEHLQPLAFGGNNQSGPISVATARNACSSGSGRLDFETETFLVQPVVSTLDASYGRLQGCSGQDMNHGHSHLVPTAAYAFQPRIARNGRGDMGELVNALTAQAGETGKGDAAPCVAYSIQAGALRSNPASGPDGIGVQEHIAYTLEARAEVQAVAMPIQNATRGKSQNGIGIGGDGDPMYTLDQASQHAVAFSCKDSGHDASVELAPTLRAMGYGDSHANGGGQLAVCFAENSRGELRLEGGDGQRTGSLSTGGGKPGQGTPMVCVTDDICPTLQAGGNTTGGVRPPGTTVDTCASLITVHIQAAAPILAFKPGQSEAAGGIFVTEDFAPTLQAQNNGSTAVPAVCFKASHFTRGKDGAPAEVTPPLSADADKGDQDTLVLAPAVACLNPQETQRRRVYDGAGIAPCLSSEEGRGHGVPSILTVRESGQGYWMQDELAGTLRAEGENRPSRPSNVIAYTGDGIVADPISANEGKTYTHEGSTFRLHNCVGQAVTTFQERGRTSGRALEVGGDLAYALTAPNGGGRAQERNVQAGMAVRRLTPRECERLQAFPDDYTLIPYRGKLAADGPRYKALGNSMCVNNMAWIGRQIAQALERAPTNPTSTVPSPLNAGFFSPAFQ